MKTSEHHCLSSAAQLHVFVCRGKLERKRKVKFLSVSQKILHLIIKAALELRAGARAEAKSSCFKIIGTFLLLVTDFSSSEAF